LSKNFNKMAKELQNNKMVHSDFITNVSHEFNTPLSSILGYSMLLQDDDLSKEEQNESLNKIISSAKRLSKLTSNILNLAKLENQDIITDQKEYSLDENMGRKRNCIEC
jgi:signal transduction histidine kinase